MPCARTMKFETAMADSFVVKHTFKDRPRVEDSDSSGFKDGSWNTAKGTGAPVDVSALGSVTARKEVVLKEFDVGKELHPFSEMKTISPTSK